MDCEKFERVLLDLLYEELDELTRAAATRHADQCSRCRELLTGYRATREGISVPLSEPPDGFESRILAAELQFHRQLPWPKRAVRAVTILSGYAMRPQLAMAALLVLMIGSSLILLRPKPGSHGSVVVTESGVPQKEDAVVVALEESEAAQVPAGAPEALAQNSQVAKARGETTASDESDLEKGEADLDLARSKAEDDAFNVAMSSYRAGQLQTAQEQFDRIVQGGGKHSAQAELLAAQATEKALGCPEALARFDSVAAGSSADLIATAIWHSANCRKSMGQTKRAALDFEKLLKTPRYAEQARQALSELEAVGEGGPILAEGRKTKAPTDPKAGASADGPASGDSLGGRASSPARPPGFDPKTALKKQPPAAPAPKAAAPAKPRNAAPPIEESVPKPAAPPSKQK